MTDATFRNVTVSRPTATTVEDLLMLDSVDNSAGNGAALSFVNNSATSGLYLALGRMSASRVDSSTVRLDLAVLNDPTVSSGDDTPPLLSLVSGTGGRRVTTPAASTVALGGTLMVGGNATFSGNSVISGTLSTSGATTLNGGLTVSGNLDVTGTVDGRDVSGDGAKLDQHLANRANPHATTAAQVGALPTAGGTISGSLSVTGLTTLGGSVTISGNVGIGTASAESSLHISRTGSAGPTLLLTNSHPTSKNSVIYLGSGRPGVGTHFFISNDWGAGNTDILSVGYNNAGQWKQYLAVKVDGNMDGNVGIGTTDPQNALHVVRRGHLNAIFDQPDTSDHLTVVVGTHGSGLRFSDSNFFVIGSQPYANRNDYGSGKEHVRITSEGHVGIGTATPRRALDVLGNIVATNMTLAQDAGRDTRTWHLDNDGGLFRIFDQPNIDTPGTARLIINADGNVGIGMAEPAAKLDIVGTIRSTAQTVPSSGEGLEVIYTGNQGYLTSYNRTANTFQPLNINGAPLSLNAFIDGNVGIGTTSPGFKLDVAGVVRAQQFVPPSDVRLKTKITPLTDTLAKLAQVRGIAFEWNERFAITDRSQRGRQIGVIAQEVEAVFPELVVTSESDGLKAVDYDRLAAILIEAVKELNHKMALLEQRMMNG